MIKVVLTNEILKYITEIDENRYKVSSVKLPHNKKGSPFHLPSCPYLERVVF